MEKLRTGIQQNHINTLEQIQQTPIDTLEQIGKTCTEIIEASVQFHTIYWKVTLLLTGSGFVRKFLPTAPISLYPNIYQVIRFIVEEYLHASLRFNKKPPLETTDLPSPAYSAPKPATVQGKIA